MSETEANTDQPEDLLERVRAGDLEAAGRLFARYRRQLVRTAQSRLDNRLRGRLDASDVVQEALREASRRLEDYLAKEPVPFALWLRQIVIDQVHKAWRRHGHAERRTVTKEVPFPDRSSLMLAQHLSLASSPPPVSGSAAGSWRSACGRPCRGFRRPIAACWRCAILRSSLTRRSAWCSVSAKTRPGNSVCGPCCG